MYKGPSVCYPADFWQVRLNYCSSLFLLKYYNSVNSGIFSYYFREITIHQQFFKDLILGQVLLQHLGQRELSPKYFQILTVFF